MSNPISRRSRQNTNDVERGIDRLDACLFLFITMALLLKLSLVFRLKVQWDEFYFLSQVYSGLRGSLPSQFQNFHVHFFTWLHLVSGNEVDQVLAARIVMYLMLVGACLFTYLIGRQFLNRSGAMFGVLCYLSFSNVVKHGASFRVDSICSFLFLWAVFLLVKNSRSQFGYRAAGLIMALALMVSLKSAFYLMAISVIFAVQLRDRSLGARLKKDIGNFLGGFVLSYGLLYSLHRLSIHVVTPERTSNVLGGIVSKVILNNPFFPGRYIFLISLYKNALLWLLLFVGLLSLAFNRHSGIPDRNRKILLAFSVLLPTLLFYRNAYPYYYVFILSPAILACGVILHQIAEDFRKKGSRIFLAFAFIFSIPVFANFIWHYTSNFPNQTVPQRELLATIHRIFPEPVPYIDGCSAVSSFPKVGPFMTSWGMENYLAAGTPIFHQLLMKQQPVFLLANIPSLDLSLSRENEMTPFDYALLEEDRKVLSRNFVHHWGMLYVLGKQLNFAENKETEDFWILVPGTYTVETASEVELDGTVCNGGATLHLGKGRHSLTSTKGPATVTIRWGDQLYKPTRPPPKTQPFFQW